jgi:hypothetical protein
MPWKIAGSNPRKDVPSLLGQNAMHFILSPTSAWHALEDRGFESLSGCRLLGLAVPRLLGHTALHFLSFRDFIPSVPMAKEMFKAKFFRPLQIF